MKGWISSAHPLNCGPSLQSRTGIFNWILVIMTTTHMDRVPCWFVATAPDIFRPCVNWDIAMASSPRLDSLSRLYPHISSSTSLHNDQAIQFLCYPHLSTMYLYIIVDAPEERGWDCWVSKCVLLPALFTAAASGPLVVYCWSVPLTGGYFFFENFMHACINHIHSHIPQKCIHCPHTPHTPHHFT